jgi:hypothetical protein
MMCCDALNPSKSKRRAINQPTAGHPSAAPPRELNLPAVMESSWTYS